MTQKQVKKEQEEMIEVPRDKYEELKWDKEVLEKLKAEIKNLEAIKKNREAVRKGNYVTGEELLEKYG